MATSKKMSLKEFKEGLKLAGHDLDVFGFDGILNTIVIAQRALQKDIEEKYPNSCLVESIQSEIDAVMDFLTEHGFYDR